MSDNESRRRESADSADRSYYSDSESYYSDRSRNNEKNSYGKEFIGKDKAIQIGNKPVKRGAFVFMGNAQEFKALKRGIKQQKPPVDLLNENKVKMAELRNKNLELLDIVTKYEFENRDLRRMLKRQEVHLKKVQLQEDSMPNFIERQSNETKSLSEQIRGLKERLKVQDKRLKEAEGQLDAKQRQLKQLNSLVHQKDLKKRQDLTQELEESHKQLANKEESIRHKAPLTVPQNLERHIENVQKNYRHEMGVKKARQKASNEELEDLRREVQRLYTLLQEKEKESAVFNIYSMQHRHKPPHRLSSSIRSTPALHHLNHTDHPFDNHPPVKKASFDELPTKKGKEKLAKTNDAMSKGDSKNGQMHASNGTETKNNNNNKDMRDINNKKDELEDLEKKIQQLNNNINTGKNNANNSTATTKTPLNKAGSKGSSSSKTKKVNGKQKEALLERMKKVDEGKYQTSATTTSNNKLSSVDNTSSIFADYRDYKPSFLDDDDETNKAFRIAKKDKLNFLSDGDDDGDDDAVKAGRSKSPVFLNLNSSNNSHLLPKRPKKQDTSLATLNGIDSDDE